VGAVLLLWWSTGALLAFEEHLDITVGSGLKTDNEGGLLCRFWEPTVMDLAMLTPSSWAAYRRSLL